jgi:hypothetical protein
VNRPRQSRGSETNRWQMARRTAAVESGSNDAGRIIGRPRSVGPPEWERGCVAFLTFLAHEGVAHIVSKPVLPGSAAAPRCAILGRVCALV